MNLNLDSRKTIEFSKAHLVGKRIESLCSYKFFILFQPQNIFQIPSEIYLLLKPKDSDPQYFYIKADHTEDPNDGWKETFGFELNRSDIDENFIRENKYSTLLYRNQKNACFHINDIEYYALKNQGEYVLFAVRFVEDENEQMLIIHHGFGRGLELIIGQKAINDYLLTHPFEKKIVACSEKDFLSDR